MRELKFKVWDNEMKRMSKPVGISAVIVQWNDGDIDMPTQFAEAKHERFIFLQYIGLKDKTGKEIYDGDVYDYIKAGRWQVLWDESHAGFMAKLIDDINVVSPIDNLNCIVIGNIYEPL